jgi:lysophospholipase L1-like esterase
VDNNNNAKKFSDQHKTLGDFGMIIKNLSRHSYFQFGQYFILLVSIFASVNAHALKCSYQVSNDWGPGFTGSIVISNDGTAPVNGWKVQWQQNGGTTLSSVWNASYTGSNPYTATDSGWNGAIPVGGSVSFGFQGSGDNSTGTIISCTTGTTTSSNSVSSSRSSSLSSLVSSSRSSSSAVSSSRSSSLSRSSSSISSQALSALTIQENTTGFCRVDGTVDNNNTGFTGAGFANTTNATATQVVWNVNASVSGVYSLEIRFANGGTTARSGQLSINNGANGTYNLTLPATGSWTTWQSETVSVVMTQGENQLVLTATSSGGLANIDYVKLTGNGLTAHSCMVATSGRVFLAGDSIVQTYTNTSSTTDQAGWGQMLSEQYNANVTIFNHAIGGRTSRRFIEEGRLDAIWAAAKSGDYLLVQFGTNDAHTTATYTINGQTIPYYLNPQTDFKTYLKQYIDGARSRGITIGLVTPTPRNSAYCTGGNGTGSWAQAMRELAAAEGVALIDLNQKTVNYLKAICPAPTPENFFFVRADGTVDGTHFQENGARILSRFVADGVGEAGMALKVFRK